MTVTIQDIETAAATLAGDVLHTPTVPAPGLSQVLGCDVRLKLENLQLTGSFKARGARHRLGALDQALAAREQEQFEAAAEMLRQAIDSVPELVALQDSLLIEQTPEGLRIQLVDQKGYSMFALGSAQPNQQTRNLVQLVTRAVEQLGNKISISGYTDSRPYRSQEGYTNWELSSDRANAARRLLIESGLEAERIALVQGRADTDPLLPDDPESERNRRISIVLLRENAVPIEIRDTVAPSELGATEPAMEPAAPPAQKTELDNGHAPG